jgi:SAM-dependent methyltransferase
MQDYSDKDERYFSGARREIEPLLPVRAERVLELGCGAGATLAWLKASGRVGHAAGIEIFAPAAERARLAADVVYRMDVERDPMPAGLGRVDLILCLDVLEHLVDPWGTVDRLVRDHLDVGGTIVVSLPNLRHHSVLRPLLLHGRWDYQDDGPMDRTHLRYFTRRTAVQLLTHPLLDAPHCVAAGFEPGTWKRRVDRFTLGCFTEFLAFHYLLSARKAHASAPVTDH